MRKDIFRATRLAALTVGVATLCLTDALAIQNPATPAPKTPSVVPAVTGVTLTLESLDGKVKPGGTMTATRTENGQALFPIRVRIKGANGKRLRLVWADGDYTVKLTVKVRDQEAVIARDIIVPPTRNASFVRAEILEESGKVSARTKEIRLLVR